MKYCIALFIFFFIIFGQAQAEDKPQADVRYALLETQPQQADSQPSKSAGDFSSSRFRNAAIMSVIVPGAGQTYLGHSTKGAIFSVLALGGLVGGYIFHNDIISNNERMADVEVKYLATGNYYDSDNQYHILKTLRDQSGRYKTKRYIFFGIAAAVWAVNIADILFYTTDRGREDLAMSAVHGSLDFVPLANGAALRISFGR